MPKPDDVRIPSPRGPLPASHICFSGDRLFVRPSLQRAEDSISHCLSASRAMARIPNMLKLEFYAFHKADGEVTASRQTVGLTGKPTDVGSPEIVGIPILHHVSPAKRLGKLLSKTKRVVEALQADDPPPAPLLRLRSLHSFAVASIDFVLSGVLLRPVHLVALQARINNAYRRALGAPRWTPADFLYGTRDTGGVGAPLLSLRNVVRLALSYPQATASRNPLVEYAALALARLQHPVSEAVALQQRLQPLGITIHALPDTSVDMATIHLQGSLHQVPPDVPLYFSADGSCSDDAIGAGFVFWHPAAGVLLRGSCAMAACAAASEDAEWLALLLAL